MIGALQENGPCFVESDSNTTYLNPYSWNNEVNMLYIDQPVQVGYSYDVPTNVTVSAKSGEVVAQDFSSQVPEQNNTLLVGTLSSQNATSTANATQRAAHAAIESSDDYSTIGPASTWHIKNEVFPAPQPVCYILDAGDSCTEDQWALVENGTAVVKDYIVVGRKEEERQGSVSESVLSDASLSQERVQQALNDPS